MKAIILAGGGGTRLWPLSRRGSPKQIGSPIGTRSLLQATYARLRRRFAAADIVVAVGATQAAAVRRQLSDLPKANLIVEPCRRDTASAIGYALLVLSRRHADETFVVINSDAHVRDEREYLRVISLADQAVRRSTAAAVLIGLRPEYPETGYGYIRCGADLPVPGLRLTARDRICRVRQFVEKPNLSKAGRYVRDGGYLWNPTLIVGRIDHFLDLYRQHLPRHAAIFRRMSAASGRPGAAAEIERLFASLPSVSIDYGILEKASGLLVLPAAFGWTDVGGWRAVKRILAPRPGDNAVRGRHVSVDSSGNLIFSATGRLVATVGLRDMAVVDTPDALLICPLDRAQEVRQVVERLATKVKTRRYL